MKNTPNLRQLVVFCIYMENNDGIIGKHMNYLFEKFLHTTQARIPEKLLDSKNLQKFIAYAEKWGLDWDSPRDYQDLPRSTPIDPITGEFQFKCPPHAPRWTGEIPCTGIFKCQKCGKEIDRDTREPIPEKDK